MQCLPENCKIITALAPAADAAGRTGAAVSLKNVNRAWVLFNVTQGNAATINLSVQQAASIAGTPKALTNATQIWANVDVSANDTLVRQTNDVSFTTDAGVKNKLVAFQINPTELDTANGYDCITVVTGASNAANITSAMFILDMKYQEATPPTAVID
ncbi:MAG: hypothetical protein ABFC57_12935 [Veillonellales bacterium]